jgi:predicted site-specific integrase-resolvase
MIEERITKKQVLKLYGIDSSTLENWIRYRGLPMIEISSHKKYIRKKDLIEFEDKMIKKNKLNYL